MWFNRQKTPEVDSPSRETLVSFVIQGVPSDFTNFIKFSLNSFL
jgi:hypothetical protein